VFHSHCGALPFTSLKKYLEAKKEEEELWKFKIFHHAKLIYNLQKNAFKKYPKSFKILLITLYNN